MITGLLGEDNVDEIKSCRSDVTELISGMDKFAENLQQEKYEKIGADVVEIKKQLSEVFKPCVQEYPDIISLSQWTGDLVQEDGFGQGVELNI